MKTRYNVPQSSLARARTLLIEGTPPTLTINRMFLTPAVIFCQKSSGTELGMYIMARKETPLPVSPCQTSSVDG